MSKLFSNISSYLASKMASTADVKLKLNEAHSLEDFFDENEDTMLQGDLSDYLNRLVLKKDLVIANIVKDSDLDKAYVYQIFSGTRKNPSRDKLIAIAFGMHLDEDETQRLLKLAGHSELYPRKKRDAVILFAIQHRKSVWEADDLLDKYGYQTILPND